MCWRSFTLNRNRLTGSNEETVQHSARSTELGRKSPSRKRGLLLGMALLGIVTIAACGNSLKPAPEFQFSLYQGEASLGGSVASLSDLRGKPLVLNFWAGLCPPCRAEMPDLQEFYDEFGDSVTLFGLDIGPFTGLGTNRDGRELLEELGVSYPAGSTTDETVVRDYEILGMPSTVFITHDGKIFDKWTGLLNRDVLVKKSAEMLALSGATLSAAGD